ncbi:DUF421 domain-containing protein [Mycolicibacterium tusciae]|uniref:DUF421 domain-containing protein n=1 Tax=Mycolicibacterium tusciae TaxID=75922 RepID=A0A1X0K1M4_9MYCO|nr:YetF domain-containing protein [Mycolicibacterium tusciae]ORB68735.1 hypothetical protein BST47_02205 [Mycolicibacterium tusciae]
MWFDVVGDIARVVLIGSAAYISLIVILRISGKRTLAKLNAFDLVVTVAVGSTLATILLNSDVSFAEGVTALALLAVLQFLVGVSVDQIRQAIRSTGQGDVGQVAAVVLESDGSLSVIAKDKVGDWSASAGLGNVPASDR